MGAEKGGFLMSIHPEFFENKPEDQDNHYEQNPNVGPDGPKIRDQAPKARGQRDAESSFVPVPDSDTVDE